MKTKVVYDRVHSSIADIFPGMISWVEVDRSIIKIRINSCPNRVDYTNFTPILIFIQKVRIKTAFKRT